MAQIGKKHHLSKPLKGFGSAGVLEVIKSHIGNAYRAVYTVTFEEAVYVLHCFRKKSHSGIETPKQDMTIIKTRLEQIRRERHG